jgi:hypothetical protein
MSKTKITKGETIRCINARGKNGLTEGNLYLANDVTSNGIYVRLVDDSGMLRTILATRFEPALKAKTKSTQFGQVRAVTVNKSDIHDVLTQYVRFGLGINATVEKIVDKFPEAIELVLTNEAAA